MSTRFLAIFARNNSSRLIRTRILTMKHYLLLLLFSCFSFAGWAQTTIQGTITDEEGAPVPFANVFLKDTYDGTSSDGDGKFKFTTTETGEGVLSASVVGFEPIEQTITLSGGTLDVDMKLKKATTELDMVVITAGAFEASDEKKAVVLKPLDIVTTAGAAGDVYGAMNTLPGVQQVGEQEGLFVRGGSAAETKTVIDEMVVQNPFFSSVPDVPQRGRFSPFLFKGTVFSTGGYSAVYGQALSSALILNTTDLATSTNTGIGILPMGPMLSHTHAFKKSSISAQGSYMNMKPYFALVPQLTEWEHEPESLGGSIVYRFKTSETGIFKLYSSYDRTKLAMLAPDLDDPETLYRFAMENQNLYINTSWKDWLNDKWSLFVGSSYAKNENEIFADTTDISGENDLGQFKVIATRTLGKYSAIKFGGEAHVGTTLGRFNELASELDETYSAGFAEADIYFTPKIAGRIGVRAENSQLLNQNNVAPRTSLAYKTGKNSQVSVAYGMFYQTPENEFLYQIQDLDFELATHFIANYQWMNNDRTLRIEAYDKEYDNLVNYDWETPEAWINNQGFGYARGIDVFWRDKKTIKYADYWISYSFLDTKRKYREFPIQAPPRFVSDHTATLVFKYWINKVRTSVSSTFTYATGRPYFNPNLPPEEFHSEYTPNFHNWSISASKLTTIMGNFTVIFMSVNNVLGRENVFGYRYSGSGQARVPIGPPNLRTFFAGIFISIGEL